MPVIVDTSIWSLGLRRNQKDLVRGQKVLLMYLRELISQGDVVLPEIVRQEILTGITEEKKFDELVDYLRAFDDPAMESEDYERAAKFSNLCLSAGVAAPVADMLICSFAGGHDWPILTSDRDFSRYVKYLPIKLLTLV